MPDAVEPTRIALFDRAADAVLFRGAAGDVTAAAFLADVRRCAAALPDGPHLVNLCTSRYWFAVGFAACLLRGQVSLLTGDHSPLGLAALCARFEGAWVLTDAPCPPDGLPCWMIGPDLPPMRQRWSLPPCTDVPLIEPDRVAAVVFSSGSTGEPIGTAKTFGELAGRSRAAAERFGFATTAPAIIIGTVPPHHMYGFETTILLPLHAAVSSWCDPVFYPGDLRRALQSAAGRLVLVTTPLHLRAMLAMKGAGRLPDMVISATAPLDAELARQAEQLWATEVLEIFGASEVGSIASRRTLRDAAWSLYPGVALTGDERPLVTAPCAAARPLSDRVEMVDGGRGFRLLGRCDDMVKLGGRRASLAGLSRNLTEIEGVSDGVFLAPDDIEVRPTARLMALVVSPCLSCEEVLGRLRQRIDPVFLPRPLVRVASLPHDALGKLTRGPLLALLAEHAPGLRPRAAA